MSDQVIEMGYERDALGGRPLSVRWWIYLNIPGRRDQGARRGVVDRGFRFARGGRTNTIDEAEEALIRARADASRELQLWGHQPSHALGPGGQLVPLDEVLGQPNRIGPA